jgi:hypothetical protein
LRTLRQAQGDRNKTVRAELVEVRTQVFPATSIVTPQMPPVLL